MDSLIDTMLCVTHEMGFAREVADQIVFKNEEKIVEPAMLSTLLSVGTELGSDAGNGDSAVLQALRRGAGDSLNQTGQQIVRRNLNMQPTLTIRSGFPVRVIVNRDLVLEPYRVWEKKWAQLKLGAIATDKPVKLTVDLPANVHRDLVAYVDLLAHEARRPFGSERIRVACFRWLDLAQTSP